MAGPLPQGDPAPPDGALPADALAEVEDGVFGVYLHVPFCRRRCGYCAFTTYADEDPVRHARFVEAARAEVRFAARVLGGRTPVPVSLFLGGGTPTLLTTDALGTLVHEVVTRLGAPAEVTVEANPDTVDRATFERLAGIGVTRVSLGMQSLRTHVLAVLDREHDPDRPLRCVEWGHAAGLQVNLDLIMGTPGETDEDWEATVAAVRDAAPDHVSAYGLMVEPGTRLAARIRHGELPAPDEDVVADRWARTDAMLTTAGFRNYEVSNWARGAGSRCRHNLLYWRGEHWWGIGPGAHSHIGGVRWWNTGDPEDYADRLAADRSPAVGRDLPTPAQRRLERVMTGLRLAEGIPLELVADTSAVRLGRLLDHGLARPEGFAVGRLALTPRGRLLAEAITTDLV